MLLGPVREPRIHLAGLSLFRISDPWLNCCLHDEELIGGIALRRSKIPIHNPIHKSQVLYDFGGLKRSSLASKSLKNLKRQDCHGNVSDLFEKFPAPEDAHRKGGEFD
jgi:hypothetical protein